MTRAELVARLEAQQHYLSAEDVELVVETIIDQLADALAGGERIEIRGFGAFLCEPASRGLHAILGRASPLSCPPSASRTFAQAKSCASELISRNNELLPRGFHEPRSVAMHGFGHRAGHLSVLFCQFHRSQSNERPDLG